MPATFEIQKNQTVETSPATAQRPTSEARVSAVVQAAYILEARTR
ncbi:MAG TPA: hypothetical protein VH081_00985 [Solirubrobacteraceae bacterium]|jgi:hypothetical protein|nr:hypothetical protein [Solirubrobacteraceae bacterium]